MRYNRGQLFMIKSELYILTQVTNDLWAFVCMNDGNRWCDPVGLGMSHRNPETQQLEIEIPDNSPIWGHHPITGTCKTPRDWVVLEKAKLILDTKPKVVKRKLKLSTLPKSVKAPKPQSNTRRIIL